MNVKYSQGYRKYNSEIPSFLVNRPRILVLHCIERIFAAKDIKSQHIECTDISKGTFIIKSQSQDRSWYLVSFGDSETMCRCGCPDWQKWWLPCKHFIAIFNTYPAWQWENLSSLYLNSPFFSLDEDLITKLQSPCNMTSSLTAEEPLTTPHLEEPQEQLNISEKHSLVDQCISDAKSPPTLDVEEDLPTRQKNHRSEGALCCDLLAQLRCATYLVHNSEALTSLRLKLVQALSEVRYHISNEDGIDLEVPTEKKPLKRKHAISKDQFCDLPQPPKRAKYVGRHGKKASENKKLIGVKTGVKQLNKAKKTPPSVKKSTEVNITKLTPAEKQRPNHSLGRHFQKQDKVQSKEILQDQVNEGEDELSHTAYSESTTADHQDQEPTEKTSTKVQGSPVCEGEDDLSNSVHSQSMTTKKTSTKPYKAQGPPVCGKEDKEADQFNQTVKLQQSLSLNIQIGSSPVRVVQGSMSQQSEEFSESNRGKQCTGNSFTFILHHATVPVEKVSKLLIDAVLKVGDRLQTVLTSALGNVGQRLSFEELQTAIQKIGVSQCLAFPDGIITGDIFSTASCMPFVTLEEGLRSALLSNAGSLLRVLEYTIAVKKLPDGCIALFDPHARNPKGFVDGDGKATLLIFLTTDATANYIRRFVRHKGCEEQAPVSEDDLLLGERSFELLPICCDEGEQSILSRIVKMTNLTKINSNR